MSRVQKSRARVQGSRVLLPRPRFTAYGLRSALRIVPALAAVDGQVLAGLVHGPAALGLQRTTAPGPMQRLDLAAAQLGVPGVDSNGDVHDSGLIALHVQALLAAWARMTGAGVPQDYGSTPADFTGTDSARMRSEVASFQRWHNDRVAQGAAKLPEDGATDPATLDALQLIGTTLIANHAAQSGAEAVAPSKPAAEKAVVRSKLLDLGLALLAGLVLYEATK